MAKSLYQPQHMQSLSLMVMMLVVCHGDMNFDGEVWYDTILEEERTLDGRLLLSFGGLKQSSEIFENFKFQKNESIEPRNNDQN